MFASRRGSKGNNVACIFVHAGAGFHSVQNEKIHLQACNDAAKSAMRAMQNAGSAVDAVELAIRILEDREITNAGYGSNLAIDGVVECDAVVVDHCGRSGGAGAVAQIKNPISLARLLLDQTTQTLSLRRVPPNLLVGQGATDFAYEHGMPVLPLDCLISPAARDRWRRWRDDLDKAERNRRREEAERYGISPSVSQTDLPTYYGYADEQEQMRMAHTKAMMAHVWNEAQPISPPPSDDRELEENSSAPPSQTNSSLSMADADDASDTTPEEGMDPCGPPGMLKGMVKNLFANSPQRTQRSPSMGLLGSQRGSDGGVMDQHFDDAQMELADMIGPELASSPYGRISRSVACHDGSSGSESDSTTVAERLHQPIRSAYYGQSDDFEDATMFPLPDTPDENKQETHTPPAPTPLSNKDNNQPLPPDSTLTNNGWIEGEDMVTDTVGAIAIDMYGNIACGASSGGIGMKHRGRIGPAALVGIGAAVITMDPDDAERTTVATVTSGTGEHMGTTMAARTCSEHVYQNVRKVPGGTYEECNEDEAVHGFITKDFMAHPSVTHSHSSGAIGVLSVKKTKNGAYLYFGHNTDSFALASMSSEESRPVCTMSRSKGSGVVAQGGRAIRNTKRKA